MTAGPVEAGAAGVKSRLPLPLRVLEVGWVVGAPQESGPDEEPRPCEGEPTRSAHGELL
jgi:hypothetical protein